ncbi:hypothetical protein [Fusobacterium necrophorum]|mgnify:CR=1 FL=1|uniref:hypothetical protein n=1 Tax=Fusobacterium necrophorum TaxID=859 RepID=UPI00242046A2|nr:hypothetical protein [Fusobacterium necrophorum]MDK4523168.1 hypothetical protein [Fusobacterium necrophorum]
MEDLKDKIFKEFQENLKKEEEVVEKTKNTEIGIVKKKKKKKKKKKNEKTATEASLLPATNEFETPEFLSFKSKLLENQAAKDFIQVLLPNYVKNGFTDISVNKYVSMKMKFPKLNAFILNPSFEDITIGKPGEIFFIKPLDLSEYKEFNLNIGKREEKIDEFMHFCLEKCIVYPEISLHEIVEMTTGKKMAIHGTIMNISDLNKTYNVIEV